MKTYFCGVIVLVLIFFSACNIAAGSYPYAEIYEIEASEADVIRAVEAFKKENPTYLIPSTLNLKDGRKSLTDHWYHVYFYYNDNNEILNTWIRANGKDKVNFALVAINEGLTLGDGNWKYINQSYSVEENEFQKEKFRRLILKEIEAQL